MSQSIKKQTQSLKSFFKQKMLSIDEDKGEITIIFDQKNIIDQRILIKCLEEAKPRIDLSLNFPVRWSNLGFILRGGWMFGKHKESFGHNGWGGSLGFADPVNGLGISYVTREINPTMGMDQRALALVKKFYELLI